MCHCWDNKQSSKLDQWRPRQWTRLSSSGQIIFWNKPLQSRSEHVNTAYFLTSLLIFWDVKQTIITKTLNFLIVEVIHVLVHAKMLLEF